MKKIICLMAAGLVSGLVATGDVGHLMPLPQRIVTDASQRFIAGRPIALEMPDTVGLLAEVAETLNGTDGQPGARMVVRYVDSIAGAHDYELAGFPCEAYTLSVSPDSIVIEAVDRMGVIRAAQTLAQMVDSTAGEVFVPAAEITDWPAFKLRGYMHDVGRSYITVDELLKEIDLLSRFKVNLFHFHLTENQAWRFESERYPALTADTAMVRDAGLYYTPDECRRIEAYAAERGMMVLPEIDMPGHSRAFTRAMGFDMQTDEGVAVLLDILDEVAEAFPLAPYIHIGADEQSITYPDFLRIMTDKVHSLGRKAVCWNPIKDVRITADSGFDMTQMWSTRGRAVEGLPNIDCRYNYANHFDVFSDVVGIYKSNIYYQPQGSPEVAGAVCAIWNDRKVPDQTEIMRQNNFYAAVLATAERAWLGGGEAYIEQGGTVLPYAGAETDSFADWERRFLHHKATTLRGEPIPYVRQCDIEWAIAGPYDNGGDPARVFAPELGPLTADIPVVKARGGGMYLRHTWGATVPALLSDAPLNSTAYAITHVYSPCEQEAGALIEFQNYSRSEVDRAPEPGQWDRKGSRVWLNGAEIEAPQWRNSGRDIINEDNLYDENFAAREPVKVTLREGWNTVLLKLPYVAADGVRLNKWAFTFVLTEPDGSRALDNIRYQAEQP